VAVVDDRAAWMIRMRKIVKKVVGVILVIVGFLALVTPLTPGSWLIPIGLELLGWRLILQDRLLAWTRARPNSRFASLIVRLVGGRRHILRDKLLTWAQARPDSRASRVITRIWRVRPHDPETAKPWQKTCV
jgi:hypothetical protein